ATLGPGDGRERRGRDRALYGRRLDHYRARRPGRRQGDLFGVSKVGGVDSRRDDVRGLPCPCLRRRRRGHGTWRVRQEAAGAALPRGRAVGVRLRRTRRAVEVRLNTPLAARAGRSTLTGGERLAGPAAAAAGGWSSRSLSAATPAGRGRWAGGRM